MQIEKIQRPWPFAVLIGWLLMGPLWAADKITLNLQDADIEAVIATVSEMTGKNFIVDPRVKGKITVISSQPLGAEALYQTFLAVLDVHGFAAMPAEGVIKIQPVINARQSAGFQAGEGGGNEYVTRVIHVQHVNPMELVPILRPLLPQEGHLAAVGQAKALVVSGSAANIQRLERIIERVDRADDEEVDVIRLSHASGAEIVKLARALGGEAAGLNLVADERTNTVLLSGPRTQRLRYRALVTHLDTPLESAGSVEVVYLNYADAKEMVRILTGISGGIKGEAAKPEASGGAENVFIMADESANALIINAPPNVMRSLKSVAKQLDFRRAQIHVEAVIAEVTTETASEFGIQWGFRDSDQEAAAGFVNFGGAGSGIVDIAAAVEGGGIPVVDGLLLGIGDLGNSVLNIGAVIRALAADANNNILSTPSLMTLDNQEASIEVGKEVPFLTGSYTSTGDSGNPSNPFQTYERKNVGLMLKVRPQINEGDAVKLEIVQEVSSISNTTLGARDLVTNKRTLSTSVMVDDGQTIVLGGLIDEALKENEERVPLLGDLPLFGGLFRYDATEKVKTNLMIFLRPTIVRDAEQAGSLTGGKYRYMRARQLDAPPAAGRILPQGAPPVLPELQPAAAAAAAAPAPVAGRAPPAPAPAVPEAPPVQRESVIPAILDIE